MSGSPIEARFAQALGALLLCDNAHAVHFGEPVVTVEREVPIGPYRVDFLLTYGEHRLVVECDGWEWHERTLEQANRDRERDQALLRAGYPTVRFTGSRVLAAVQECVTDAVDTLFVFARKWQPQA